MPTSPPWRPAPATPGTAPHPRRAGDPMGVGSPAGRGAASPASLRPSLGATCLAGLVAGLSMLPGGCSRHDTPPVSSPPPPSASASQQSAHALAPAAFELPPLPGPSHPPTTHTLVLTPVDRTVDLGLQVRYRARTYNGQLPGPIVHAREGDSIQLRLVNPRATSPNVRSAGAAHHRPSAMHSISVHGSGRGEDLRSIAPGEQLELAFTAAVPGVFLYHSITPMALERVADGLYGAMVIEPREGWPTRADHSFVLVQSELYARPAGGAPPHEAASGTQPRPQALPAALRLDPVTVRTGQVSYMLHNGQIFGSARRPFRARPGQRIRIFLLNAGPNHAASIGIEGLVFDRVYLGGHPANLQRGLAVVGLPPGGGAVAEVVVPASGYLSIADHSMRQGVEGASSQLATVPLDQETPPASLAAVPSHGVPPPGSPLRAGFDVFTRRCALCHGPRAGTRIGWEGPALDDVAARQTRQQILGWMDSPQQRIASDPAARRLRARYRYTMPAQTRLRPTERAALLDYLEWLARPQQALRRSAATPHQRADPSAGATSPTRP